MPSSKKIGKDTSNYKDPFQFKVPSTQQSIPTEIIQHIFSFLSISDLMRACVSKLWLNHVIAYMRLELTRNSSNTIDNSNPMKITDANTRLYFFTYQHNLYFYTYKRDKELYKDFLSLNLTERREIIITTIHKELMFSLEKACQKGDHEKVKKLLENATAFNVSLKWDQSVDSSSIFYIKFTRLANTTALHLAAANGGAECIKLLIKAGASPNAFGSTSDKSRILTTPLMLATRNCHPSTVFTLLVSGARTATRQKIYIKDEEGLTDELASGAVNSLNADNVAQIKKFINAKIHIENAEEKLITSCKDRSTEINCREYIKKEFKQSYLFSPELFKNVLLGILGKEKLMYREGYFDYKGIRQAPDAIAIKFFIDEFVAVLDSLNIQDADLQLALADQYKKQENHQQAFRCYKTAKRLQGQPSEEKVSKNSFSCTLS